MSIVCCERTGEQNGARNQGGGVDETQGHTERERESEIRTDCMWVGVGCERERKKNGSEGFDLSYSVKWRKP